MSLEAAALRYYHEDKRRHLELEQNLLKIRYHKDLSAKKFQALKLQSKALYVDFYINFEGVIYYMPIAASNFQFRFYFRPNILRIN